MLDKLQRMSTGLLEAVRKTRQPEKLVHEGLSLVQDALQASVLLVDHDGRVIEYINKEGAVTIHLNEDQEKSCIDSLLNEQLKNSVESSAAFLLSNLYIKGMDKSLLNDYHGLILPLTAAGKRIGTMLIYRKKGDGFDDNELAAAQLALAFSTLVMDNVYHEEYHSNYRSEISVKSALDTLSYSELEAVIYIFGELNAAEGLLVASKVADKYGITRSVIVNGLRKLESAGLIESRSLGMKGTFIKVLNHKLLEELHKLQN